jgi:hypothetical protein
MMLGSAEGRQVFTGQHAAGGAQSSIIPAQVGTDYFAEVRLKTWEQLAPRAPAGGLLRLSRRT